MPGAPCESDVYMAPDPEHASPVSWAPCGNGCSELVVDWSTDDAYRVMGQVGASGGDKRYVAYTRYLSAKGPYELQLVRLPDNLVLFDAIYQSTAGPWDVFPIAMSPSGHLLELMGTSGGPGFEHYSVMYLVPPDGSPLEVMLSDIVGWGALEATVSSELWAMSYQGAMAWGWHGRSFGNEMNPGWSSPDGRSMFGITATGSNVFFSTWHGDALSQIEIWTKGAGTAPLISFASKAAGGACCLLTDGQQMVWFQATGYLGGEKYADVKLMRSALATSPAALQPAVLRPAYQDTVIGGGGVIGGGYAVHVERPVGAPLEDERIIVTRLTDGYYWVVTPPPGKLWFRPLYVDADELALVEDLDTTEYTATNYTIVRLSIASLGPPLPPGSGF